MNAKPPAIVGSNGDYIVIEAESANELGNWVVHQDNSKYEWLEGFTGDGCIQFTGNRENSGPPDSILTYRFKVKERGIYRLLAHGLEAPMETHEGDKANDCYVRLLGAPKYKGEFTKFVLGGDSYQWSWNINLEVGHHMFEPPIYRLREGVYQLQIAGRSKNFFLDRFVLYPIAEEPAARSLSLDPVKFEEGKLNGGYVYDSAKDFASVSDPELGEVYVDKWRNVLAVDATKLELRKIFSGAALTFEGKSGVYDVQIKTMTEIDGESVYRFYLNGERVGHNYKNPASDIDYSPSYFTWEGVSIKKGDTIRIDSKPDTNGKIPEGDETAWARGRWVSLTLRPST
ncbi:hypothetical protein [Pelagicoccus mobilis]|uniref:Uncharacterized protein n=1 Tax=Pelagicoccus mobilis TaxID=415221 RepID=A0A934RW82_9BACT|nr:hypothetical protein [Pelagicoccus mobilis]MBK1875926.1 hypothetical protein [Pelagicoccus mobilis]